MQDLSLRSREKSTCILTGVSFLMLLACFAFATPVGLQDREPPAASLPTGRDGPIDVLTDTKGYNIKPYLSEVIAGVRNSWYLLINNDSHFPKQKKGHVTIEFRVTKDGHVSDVKYRETSGNESLDRVAYSAIAGSDPLQAIPAEFPCRFIKLRFNFYYNPAPGEVVPKSLNEQVLPCVTSKIQFSRTVSMTVVPGAAQVEVGKKAQFAAQLDGAAQSDMAWSVAGLGCEGMACGFISTDGLYTAPSHVPNPPTVTVRAASLVTSGLSGSSNVTIVAAGASR